MPYGVIDDEQKQWSPEYIASEQEAAPMLTSKYPMTPSGAFRAQQATRGVVGFPAPASISRVGREVVADTTNRINNALGITVPSYTGERPWREKMAAPGEKVTTTATLPLLPPVVPEGLRSFGVTGMERTPAGGVTYRTDEGYLSAGPETAATRAGDIRARGGVFGAADRTRQGIVSEFEGQRRADLEDLQKARSDEAYAQLEAERAAGIVPATGMREYEQNVQRMKMENLLDKLPSTGVGPAARTIAPARAGVISDIVKATGLGGARQTYIEGQSAVEKGRAISAGYESAARVKAGAEAAKLGLQAQNVASQIQLRQTQIQDMAMKSGLFEPMKLQLQQAKDETERTQIQRRTYEQSIRDTYQDSIKRLESSYGGMLPRGEDGDYAPEVKKELNRIYTERDKHLNDLKFMHPYENDIYIRPDGTTSIRRGDKWYKLPGAGQGVVPEE